MYRALRRYLNTKKALRKRNICRKVYGHEWYFSLHEYSKNKIHCSCGMCRFKPSWDPDAKPMQDIRTEEHMNSRIKEYERE